MEFVSLSYWSTQSFVTARTYARKVFYVCASALYLVTHSAKMNRKVHQCIICGYTTKKHFNLRKHLWRHMEFKPFIWRIHLVFSANMNQGYECPLCNYRTRRKVDLDKHIQTHNKENRIFASYATIHVLTRATWINILEWSILIRTMWVTSRTPKIIDLNCI